MAGATPEAFQSVVFAGLGRENVDQQVAVIRQHPFGLAVPFDIGGQLAGLMFQAQTDFVADGLHLPLISAGADDEVVGESGDAGEVEDYQVGGLFGFGCAGGNQPGWRGGFGNCGFLEIGLGQNRLLEISYYAGGGSLRISLRDMEGY
jgi:hypothetical protein